MDDALRPTKSCETESINGCIVERYHAIAAAAQVKRQADNSTSRGVRFTCCSMSMSRCTLMSGLCCMLDPVDDARRSTPRGAWWMVDRNTHNPRDPRRGTLSSLHTPQMHRSNPASSFRRGGVYTQSQHGPRQRDSRLPTLCVYDIYTSGLSPSSYFAGLRPILTHAYVVDLLTVFGSRHGAREDEL